MICCIGTQKVTFQIGSDTWQSVVGGSEAVDNVDCSCSLHEVWSLTELILGAGQRIKYELILPRWSAVC